jgi:hypothetical protein
LHIQLAAYLTTGLETMIDLIKTNKIETNTDVADRAEIALLDGWTRTCDDLPLVKYPVVILLEGVRRIGELRVENPTHEETFQPFLYWDDPYNDGQGWDDEGITHWCELPAV